ncbi:hypothetical protein [Sphingomonas sp. PP-CC-3A-396]|uniref:hypothetical protein n=1 Tax=Sphingomonas sp. PP-CC-3A-396 TaxID=2135655 RepID=UPI001044705C|nr:hypothetical protein [Sphingomonas sp. PP-CC-3A-396]TCQ04088.1 hypothetical protein C8J40_109223 [Sphingomonas sp. PP-CC-3A-396]
MLLTLPFEMGARVAAAPTVVMLLNGKCVAGFTVSDPACAEIPAVVVRHCQRCNQVGDGAVRACLSPDCPSRDRKAA